MRGSVAKVRISGACTKGRNFPVQPPGLPAPPWPDIYAQDSERKQTLDEAERTYEAMIITYGDYSYELVEIPRLPVGERVRFIIESAGIASSR